MTESKKPKVVNLKDYKNKILLRKHMDELDRLGYEHYSDMTPTEKKGYDNFMRLMKALDKKNDENLNE